MIFYLIKVEFNWDEYLKQTNSESAPKTCFRQHEIPPENLFKVGDKIETVDPRNTSSICIGTVIETQGPRLRLRLDGTDDRNDFWLLVDSENIHPFGFTTKRGGTINPPLGFRNNLSTWPRFFDKLVQSSENVFADESCFKQPPVKPVKNDFKKGQKLEAVDAKNPHLICPATVTDIDKDKIFISFDGWSQSSSFWCIYSSRDIFPVGWCKLANHPLQTPGNLEEKKQRLHRRSVNTSKTIKEKANHNNSDTHNDSSIHETSVPNQKSPNTKQSPQSATVVDLSRIKQEAIDHNEINNESTHNKSTQENKPPVQTPIQKLCVYVNSQAEVGHLIDREKFFSQYKKFGPDTPKYIFRCVLQAFIDCAYDSTRIFELMQDGDSTSYMKYKTANRSEKKYLPKIENDKQLWHNLRLMCKLLSMDDNLFSKKKDALVTSNENTHKSINNIMLNNDLNSHLTEAKVPDIINTHKLKRQSTSIDDLHQNKLFKADKIVVNDSPYHWNVEQVTNYVRENDPNLSSYVDSLKYQEIDGKALMLLTTEIMMKYLGLKLGPALKLSNLIDKLKKSCNK